MATYSGTPATVVAGQKLTSALWNDEVRGPLTALAGPWNAFTPTLSQGVSTDIAATKACEYVRVGKYVTAKYRVDATAGGSSGSDIALTLPVTAASSGYVAGSAYYIDANSTDYVAGVWVETTTTVRFIVAAGKIGSSPAIAVESGDIVTFTITYEAA